MKNIIFNATKMIIIILLILIFLMSITKGAKEQSWPLYSVRKFPIPSYKYPEYCNNEYFGTSFLPEYSADKKKKITREVYGPLLTQYIVCMEYMCFYSALKFAATWKGDIVYIDGFRGVVPYLLAELLGKKITYITKKKPIVKHKNITYTSIFPKKLHNLIYFAVYAPRRLDDWAGAHAYTRDKFLELYKLKPANYLALLQFDNSNLPLGNLHVPPFSYPSNSPFLLLEGKYTKTFTKVDVVARSKIFNNCRRPNGDYDLWFAHSALRFVKDKNLIWNYLGPLPAVDERITIKFPYEFTYIDSSDLANSLYFDIAPPSRIKREKYPITSVADIIYETFFLAANAGSRFVKHQEPDDLRLQSFIKLIYNSDTVNLYRPESAKPDGELIQSYMHPTLLEYGKKVVAALDIPQYRVWIPNEEFAITLFAEQFKNKIICVVGTGTSKYKNVVFHKIPFVEKNDSSFL